MYWLMQGYGNGQQWDPSLQSQFPRQGYDSNGNQQVLDANGQLIGSQDSQGVFWPLEQHLNGPQAFSYDSSFYTEAPPQPLPHKPAPAPPELDPPGKDPKSVSPQAEGNPAGQAGSLASTQTPGSLAVPSIAPESQKGSATPQMTQQAVTTAAETDPGSFHAPEAKGLLNATANELDPEEGQADVQRGREAQHTDVGEGTKGEEASQGSGNRIMNSIAHATEHLRKVVLQVPDKRPQE